MNAILSIKPQYVNAILKGEKTVEFRKKVFKNKVEKVYIYSSAPVQKIVGYFTINEIIEDLPINLWKRFNQVGSIDKKSFFAYFARSAKGYSICLDSVIQFQKFLDPKEVFESFTPPQSYCYTDITIKNKPAGSYL